MRLAARILGSVLYAGIAVLCGPVFLVAALLGSVAERLEDYGNHQPWEGL